MDDKERIAELEQQLASEKQARAEDKTEYEKTIAEKNAVIEQKTNDIVGARKQAQKLKQLSEEEKERLSEKEIELHNAMLAEQERREALEKDIAERNKRDVEARRDSAIKRMVGDNEELKQKVLANYARIKDAENAFTDEDVARVANEAFNMLGEARPDPINSALGDANGGNPPQTGTGERFSDTQRGKEVAKAIGIDIEPKQK
jgi:hypothetical protein